MTQTSFSPDEIATRQLIEWCARIERRRQVANSRTNAVRAEGTPQRPETTPRSDGSPTKVA